MTSRTSGPRHGSAVRPADCQAIDQPAHRLSPTASATAAADSRSWSGYGSSTSARSGSEWAVKSTLVRSGSDGQRVAHGVGEEREVRRARGASCRSCATWRSRVDAAATSRSWYCPTDDREKCGASTRPTMPSTPSSASVATASSMNGAACFWPSTTRHRPGALASRAAASPARCASVRSASGEMPPMAS